MRGYGAFLLAGALATIAAAAPKTQALGNGLYAYISDNDASSNSVFLIGKDSILVVDTGFDRTAGEKLLSAIRAVSPLPVRYIINTHYHRDHQAANGIVGPRADIVTTSFTRTATLAFLDKDLPRLKERLTGEALASLESVAYRVATITIDKAEIYVDNHPVHVEFRGPAHTMGDLVVEFPDQRVIATGDLFLNHSSPAMDRGSVLNWIQILGQLLTTPAQTFVPGHFEVGSRQDLQRFHDYLAALRDQVSAQVKAGATWEQVARNLHMQAFSDFRQFPNFHATVEDNARVLYNEIKGRLEASH
ncbi:MAG TPA: MBL fold metallo-hydrolase [Bryobacteraceae bacterium]|nr:MBL fold metallo-hydrolase [Bryobacteraceae bacterium]